MTQVTMEQEKNNKLVKGIIIGGILGGVVSLLDSSTRSQVKETAVTLKDSSKEMINQVRENPGEVKKQMMQQFKSASETLKEAIRDAQNLYERLNKDVFGKVNEVMDLSNETLSTAMEAKGELKDIGAKVVEAGAGLTETVKPANLTSASSGSTADSKDKNEEGAIRTDNKSTNYGPYNSLSDSYNGTSYNSTTQQ